MDKDLLVVAVGEGRSDENKNHFGKFVSDITENRSVLRDNPRETSLTTEKRWVGTR